MKKKRRRQIIYVIFLAVLMMMGLFLKKKADSWQAVSMHAISEEAENTAPQVALTFDDGPHPVYTEELLEGLRERGVKATFFVVGENIPGNEKLLRQMEEDGHLIGNHTYDHTDISKLGDAQNCRELKKTSDLVKKVTGHGTAYVRPPFGNWKDTMDCQVTMIAVKWTIDTQDWKNRNVTEIVNKIMKQVTDQDIILMHDYYQTSVEAALQAVDRLKAEGYEFVTVDELILP